MGRAFRTCHCPGLAGGWAAMSPEPIVRESGGKVAASKCCWNCRLFSEVPVYFNASARQGPLTSQARIGSPPVSGVKAACLTHNLWEQLSSHVYVFLNQTTLADVVGDRMAPCPAVPDFTVFLDEEGARA